MLIPPASIHAQHIVTNQPLVNRTAPVQRTLLPATNNLETEESITLCFTSEDSLRTQLQSPSPIDGTVLEIACAKLKPLIGQTVYPSTLAKAVFEMAFTDPTDQRLTPEQRTRNVGYLLSNLGCGEPEVVEKLFAFYYGYSFAHFANK